MSSISQGMVFMLWGNYVLKARDRTVSGPNRRTIKRAAALSIGSDSVIDTYLRF